MSMAAAARRRQSLTPALAAAAAVHLAVFLAATFLARSNMTPIGTAVPINIVSSAMVTDSRPAEVAPETQAAQTEAPTPDAKPPDPPPVAQAPAPQPKPAPAKPAPPTPVRPPKPALNLDALAANIARTTKPTLPRPASGLRGPARRETAPVARVDAGQGVSQSDISGLSQLLERLWNPSCNVSGGDAVVIPVKFSIDDGGRVVGRITEGGRDASSDPVTAAAARRAIDAVHQAEPYGPPFRGKAFTVIFDAKTACANH